jgi:hypothetical protein
MFFKNTLTVPKIKDLVNSPNQKYQNIYDTISHKFDSNSYTNIDLLPSEVIPTMKDELKSFLKKQLNTDNTSTDIMAMDSQTVSNFSNY